MTCIYENSSEGLGPIRVFFHSLPEEENAADSVEIENERIFVERYNLSMEEWIQNNPPRLIPPRSFNPSDAAYELDRFLRELSEEQIKNSQSEYEANQEELKEIHEKIIEKTRESLEKIKKAKSWGTLSEVCTYASSVLAICVGAAAIATPAGQICLAYGALTLMDHISGDSMKNKMAEKLAGGDEQKQQKWVVGIQIGFSLLCIGTGVGAAQGLSTLLAENAGAGASAMATLLQSSSILGGSSKCAGSVYECQAKLADADSQGFQNQNLSLRESRQVIMEGLKETLEYSKNLSKQESDILNDQANLQRKIME